MSQTDHPLISVTYSQPAEKKRAANFAEQYQLPCCTPDKASTELLLNFSDMLVELIDVKQNMHLSVDFIRGSLGHRKKYGGGRGQTIAKAIGMKQGKSPPYVLDATAGLAKDSFVFACLGCKVTLIERSAVIAELVKDGIARASLNTDFFSIIEQGFEFHHNDALSYIQAIEETAKPEVIYLDPMYPEKKKSASVKKNMQMLQKLLGHDLDTDEVLKAALNKAEKRVVVKRPKGAAVLETDRSPTLSYESKATRYDVYILK